jgi:uncharacterized protein YdeI (YjbR/CyaY-like superfamily)
LFKLTPMPIDRPEVFFASVQEFEAWLDVNVDSTGIWAVYFKKSSGQSDLYWESLVESCLCFGWIDSLPGKVDEIRTKTYIAPRKRGSGWSRRNQILVENLQRQGRLQPRGSEVIERAKADGSWHLFDAAEDLVLSDDLVKLFSQNLALGKVWETLTESQRKQKLQILYSAKTQQTRAARLTKLDLELRQKLAAL